MANKACVNRLQKEYKAIMREPVPGITTHPSPSNILEWHFIIEGQPDSDYAGGVYHGKVTFPAQYPYKPPSLLMVTPSGRFATNTRLCLSMTDFHPESWNPMWSVSTILTGLMSFMHETAHTTGAISSSQAEKQRLARESLAFNMRNPTFKKLFPEWVKKYEEQQQAAAQQRQAAAKQPAQQSPLPPAPQQLQGDALPPQPVQGAVTRQHPNGRATVRAGRQHRGVDWQGWVLGAAGVALVGLFLAGTMGQQQGYA